MLSSAAILILTFIFFTLFGFPVILYEICFGVFGCIIFLLAPVDNPSKRFDVAERKAYRKRSIIILAVESLLFVTSCYFYWILLVRSLCMVFFVACMSVSLGILKNGVHVQEKDQ